MIKVEIQPCTIEVEDSALIDTLLTLSMLGIHQKVNTAGNLSVQTFRRTMNIRPANGFYLICLKYGILGHWSLNDFCNKVSKADALKVEGIGLKTVSDIEHALKKFNIIW